MRILIFATNNANKVMEVSGILHEQFNIRTLAEEGIDIDIDEPFDTLDANATRKAETIKSLTGKDCFSEDTGLFVPALGGAPGVKSARYAGDTATSDENIEKLLKGLNGQPDRGAYFKTVVCLLLRGKKYLFSGVCKGNIIAERRGKEGFGYDSVFLPEGSSRTFAEMTMAEKNFFSHRRKAIEKLAGHLANIDI